MNQTNSVRDVMGEYALTFYYVDAVQQKYKYLNDRSGKMSKMRKAWIPFLPMFDTGTKFFCLVTKTVPSKSKSGSSYQIMGVLSTYSTYDDAEEVSKSYRTKHKWLETDAEKLAWTKQFAQGLNEWHAEDGDFSSQTFNKLMEIV